MLINNELNVPCPAGFHVMDDEERSKLKFIKEGEGVCLSNPEGHMIFVVGVKKTNAFVKVLLKPEDFAANMRKSIIKGNSPFGIEAEDLKSLIIAGAEARGFRYTYKVQNTGMTGKSYAVFRKNAVYYVHLYIRTALETESTGACDAFLSGLAFND